VKDYLLYDRVLDIVAAVSKHRMDIEDAHEHADMEDMVAGFDEANARLWSAVLTRREQ
jgi:hypothetical protein